MSKFHEAEFRLKSEHKTAEELLSLSDDGYRYELVKGELHKMPPAGFEHGVRGIGLTWRLAQYVETNRLGRVTAAETGFKIAIDPDTVRAPDIGFVRADRITDVELPKGYFPGPPDLAVEVVSPNDTFSEVEGKVMEWLMAGCSMVWVVNPGCRTVTVYRSFTDIRILTGDDVLDGAEVIPGFQCVISDLFI
jgi:Uma2 family endonuclease